MALEAQRTYTIYGKTNLTDAVWHSPNNSSSRFFKGVGEIPHAEFGWSMVDLANLLTLAAKGGGGRCSGFRHRDGRSELP